MHHSIKRVSVQLLTLAMLFFVTACLGARPVEDLPAAPAIPSKEINKEVKTQYAPPYRVQVGDILDIKLLLNPELDDQVAVRPDGRISTVIAQDVIALNRTPMEIQFELNTIYKKYLSEPKVAVIVRSFAPSRIYVTGEVNDPGEFITVGPNLTLLQAIARAGGVRNSADEEKILIIRHHNTPTPQALQTDYQDATTGENPRADVQLEPYDVVFVPRHGVGNAYLNYEQYLKQFVSPGVG
ncbi:MAG: polysaccharide export protein, partial [Alphaproteobacteria bacterium]|nr:polysaccharide export protein [Alphaproteobacteria bacterium]